MEGLSVWVLSIVGIVVLGVLVDVIIPEGQTNKYIKSIFAVVTVFVIASPIPKLLDGDFNLDEIFTESPAAGVDGDYLNYLTELKIAAMERDCVKAIEELGVIGAAVEVDGTESEGKIAVKQISVDLKNSVMNGQGSHIDITGKIVSKISEMMNVNKEQVKVDGRVQAAG